MTQLIYLANWYIAKVKRLKIITQDSDLLWIKLTGVDWLFLWTSLQFVYGDWFTLSEVVDEQVTRLRRSCHHSGFHGGPFSGVDVTLTRLYSQHWLGLNVNTTNKVRHTCSVGETFFGI